MSTVVSPLRILFIGGTGTISASSVRLAVAQGMDVFVLNRGNNSRGRVLPDDVTWLTGDITDPGSVLTAIGDLSFDTVVNLLSFDADDSAAAVKLFTGRTKQYILISSASIYHKPIGIPPIMESNLKKNEFLAYAGRKIAAEEIVMRALVDDGFPATIVRPSHTYDDVNPPLAGGWTIFDRIEQGKEIVVHGDGTSLWTLTHAADFAEGLVGLFGNSRAIGEDFHITSNDVYTWDQIYRLIGETLGVAAKIVHVPSELFLVGAPDWGWSELFMGDLGHSAIFDNSKIKKFVPTYSPQKTWARSVRDLARWRSEHPAQAAGEPAVNDIIDRMARGFHQSEKVFAALAPKA